MPNLIDLTGNEYGNWIVISKSQSRKGKVYWNCKCKKCGFEKEIQGTHLKNGRYSNHCRDDIIISKDGEKLLKEKRICVICGKEFNLKPNGYTRKYCYECSPTYKEDRTANITAIRHAIKKRLVEYKGGKCEKCGYDKSIMALQFHHMDPNEKDFELSTKYNNGVRNMTLLFKEVDKCRLLCANCHAEEHEKNF